jgi:hypothetical protein
MHLAAYCTGWEFEPVTSLFLHHKNFLYFADHVSSYNSGRWPTWRIISFVMCLFGSSTCFEQLRARPQEDNCINLSAPSFTFKYMQICNTTTKAMSVHLSVYMKPHKINVNQNTAQVQTFFTQATNKRRHMRHARCSVRLQLEACHAVWPAANSPQYYHLQQISYVISHIFYT